MCHSHFYICKSQWNEGVIEIGVNEKCAQKASDRIYKPKISAIKCSLWNNVDEIVKEREDSCKNVMPHTVETYSVGIRYLRVEYACNHSHSYEPLTYTRTSAFN